MKRLLFYITLLALMAACTPMPKEIGALQGHVTVGPLVPVVQEGVPEPTPHPEVYAERKVVIYKMDGETEVARAKINAQGDYKISLPSGTYIVDINRIGIDSADGLPVEIEIFTDQVTLLDIDIDTGIR